jgi:hypothetical protein
VPLIAEQHTVDERGPYVAGKLLVRRFSVEDDGEFYIQSMTAVQLKLYLYQVFRPSRIIPE